MAATFQAVAADAIDTQTTSAVAPDVMDLELCAFGCDAERDGQKGGLNLRFVDSLLLRS